MPKGRVESREVTCRGCGRAFVSDRPGKASWYCGTCPASPRRSAPYVPMADRDPLEAARREADRLRRIAEKEAERTRRAAARAQAKADRRAAKEADRAERAARRDLEAAQRRTEREREAELDRCRRELERITPGTEKAVVEAREKLERVRTLRERIQQLSPTPAVAPAEPWTPFPEDDDTPISTNAEQRTREEVDQAVSTIRTGEVSELLGHVRRTILRRIVDGRPVGRQAVRRAVVGLARAQGIVPTRQALRVLAVEALAWEWRLTGRMQDPGDFVADELADAA